MRRLCLIIIVIISTYGSVYAGAADFTYSIKESLNGEAPAQSFFNGKTLMVKNIISPVISTEFTLKTISGARFCKLFVRHILFTTARYTVSIDNGSGYSLCDGVFSDYAFDGTMLCAIPDGTDSVRLKIDYPMGFIGALQDVRMRFYDTDPQHTVTLTQQYPEVTNAQIIVAEGFGKFPGKERDTLSVRKAERAALLDAYRNLAVTIRKISSQDQILIDDSRVDGFIRGAAVQSKETTEDGIKIIVGIPVNGPNGLNQLMKE